MISVPIFVFILLVIGCFGNILGIIWFFVGRHIDKKDYHRYLEEEYGEHKK